MKTMRYVCIILLYFCYILRNTGTKSQTTCPTNCNCKYDNGSQLLTTATCVNIQFQSLPFTLPSSLHNLIIKNATSQFLIPLGELRHYFLDRKPELQMLIIENYGIKALGVQCFKHNPNLTSLILTNNILQTLLENNFDGLVSLNYLDLSRNNLTVLDDFVFRQLTALQELKISFNELTTIGENSFKGLIRIEKIDVSSNKISSIHKDAFIGLSQMKEINMLNNEVLRLEGGTFSNLNNLLSVNLRNNKIVHIDSNSITGTALLRYVNLAQNSLQTIPTLFLQTTSSQQLEVDLSRNNLSILSNGELAKVSLQTLYLVGNLIKRVEPDAFKNSFIRKIDLQQNQLQHLPEAIKLHINQSTIISLAYNPWICDCDIYWMTSILTTQTQAPVCAEPVSYKGWTVSYFSKNITLTCSSGSLPGPTKGVPVPLNQGIITTQLGTTFSSYSKSSNQSNTTSETYINKGDDTVAIIAGSMAGLLFLIILIAIIVYAYLKHVHSKVHCEHNSEL